MFLNSRHFFFYGVAYLFMSFTYLFMSFTYLSMVSLTSLWRRLPLYGVTYLFMVSLTSLWCHLSCIHYRVLMSVTVFIFLILFLIFIYPETTSYYPTPYYPTPYLTYYLYSKYFLRISSYYITFSSNLIFYICDSSFTGLFVVGWSEQTQWACTSMASKYVYSVMF